MLAEDELRQILSSLPTHAVHGPWFRVVDYSALQGAPPDAPPDSPPQPLWPGGPKLRGQRFTPQGAFDCLYMSSDPMTAFAETYRVFLVPGGPLFAVQAVPTVVLTIDGMIADALDLTDPTVQDALHTNVTELTGEWRLPAAIGREPPTHLLARAAYETGRIHGLLYTSAKNSDQGRNLVVFTGRFGCGQRCWIEVYDPSGHLYQRFP